jgi:predicted transcriptional regulator
MRLKDIITSEVRVKLMIELFSETNKQLYVRELTRRVGTEINAVRRELKRFLKAGIIRKEQRGNRLYYLIRKDYPFYYEILGMVAKEVGIGKHILDNEGSLGKIKLALLATSFVEGREASSNELDLLVVGDVDLHLLAELVKKSSAGLGREINYTVMNENDFAYHKKRREFFLMAFITAPHIFITGDAAKYLTF